MRIFKKRLKPYFMCFVFDTWRIAFGINNDSNIYYIKLDSIRSEQDFGSSNHRMYDEIEAIEGLNLFKSDYIMSLFTIKIEKGN